MAESTIEKWATPRFPEPWSECETENIARIGVVLSTGDCSAKDISNELTPPVVGYFRKPFRLRELWNTVCPITQQQSSADAGGLLKELTVHSRRTIQRS